jgi:hypothetical protein
MKDKVNMILAKIFHCDESTVPNIVLHISVGLITVIIYLFSSGLGILFGVGFLVFEVWTSKVAHDKGYPEIQGWLWGIGLLAIPLLIAGV